MSLGNPMDLWWLIMVLINAASVGIYSCLFVRSVRSDSMEPENRRYKAILRFAGAIFLAVSMYRSVFVCSYPSRLAWFDTPFNGPLVIRILATFAELSFAVLVMVPVLHINREMPLPCRTGLQKFLIYRLPYGTFLCLFTAQFFAYTGLFTQHLLLFTIEETLWALGFLCIAPAALCQARNVCANHGRDPAYRFIKVHLILLSAFTVGYLCYQLGYALPFRHYLKLAADLKKPHLQMAEGASLALHQYTATHDFDAWGGIGFFLWHSG